jgi:hypothetical protein
MPDRGKRGIMLILIAVVVVGVATGFGGASWALAQDADSYGLLSVDEESLSWQPGTGEKLSGRHDGLGLLPNSRDLFARLFVPDGLATNTIVVAPVDLVITVQREDRSHIQLAFTPLAAGQYGDEIQWAAGEPVTVLAGDFWPGDIFVFSAAVTIAGEVAGDLIVVGGDVTIREAAVVRGAVIVIGGVLRQQGDGKIYGDIFAPGGHRRPRLSISRAWDFEEEGFSYQPVISYDRVDGFRGGVSVHLRGSVFEPRLHLTSAYAFASETWQADLEFRQRLSRTLDIEAFGRLYRLTETDDSAWVSGLDNTLYALIAGSDYRDYFGVDGGDLGVDYKYRERGSTTVLYRNTEYRWLDAHPNLWHLFRSGHDFHPNFAGTGLSKLDSAGRADAIALFEQRTSAVLVAVAVDPKDTERRVDGFNGSLLGVYEIAGGGLGGDFDYDRLMLHASGWWNTGSRHRVFLRLFYGAGRRDLPPNKLFYLGGVGSLRGYGQKAFVGDKAVLLTAEYRLNYWTNDIFDGGVIVFCDAGQVATGTGIWKLDQFKTDIGIGLGLGDGVRLDIAKGLDRSGRDIKVTLQLTATL